MFNRTLIPAIAAGVVAAVVPLTSAPAAPAPASFTLTAQLDRQSMVKGGHHRRPSPGDTFVFSTSLHRDGRPDGRGEFVQTVVDPRYQGIAIRADLLLSDGSLELQSAGLSRQAPGAAKPSAQTDMAIVGGTGAYAGARGSVQLTPVGQTAQRLDVVLSN